MSTYTPVTRKVSAQAADKRGNVALVLVLVIICLCNLVLVLASETFARAVGGKPRSHPLLLIE